MSLAATIAASVIVILLVILAMAIGVLCGRPAIRGSCGGVGNAGGCALCAGECPERNKRDDRPREQT